MSDNLSPIILFVYNRLDHTRQTVEALQKNELAPESTLYVFADGAKEDATAEQRQKVQDVRDYIHTITGFKKIIIEEASRNKGLANSVITGVTKVINDYGKVIVVEDDIVTNPFFLRFMNDCLDVYAQRDDIFSVGAFAANFKMPLWYKKDIYIVHRPESWGWATWKNRWEKADWNVSKYSMLKEDESAIKIFNKGGSDLFPMLNAQMEGRIDSWAVRWAYSLYVHDAYCVYPVHSFVKNIGMDGSGVHCSSIGDEQIMAKVYDKEYYKISLPVNISFSENVEKRFSRSQGVPHTSSFEQVRNFLLYRLSRVLNNIANKND